MFIKIKDIMALHGCCDKTARSYAKKVKKIYGVKKITVYHYADYLGLHPMHILRMTMYQETALQDKKIIKFLLKSPLPSLKKPVKNGKNR